MAALSFACDLIGLTTILGNAAYRGEDNIHKHPDPLGVCLLYIILLLQHIQHL